MNPEDIYKFEEIHIQGLWAFACTILTASASMYSATVYDFQQAAILFGFAPFALLPILFFLTPGGATASPFIARYWYPTTLFIAFLNAGFTFTGLLETGVGQFIQYLIPMYVTIGLLLAFILLIELTLGWPLIYLAAWRVQRLLTLKGYWLQYHEYGYLYFLFETKRIKRLPPREELLTLPGVETGNYFELKSILKAGFVMDPQGEPR